MTLTILAFAVFAQGTDAISGGAGWVGAGLLGAVLSWLTLVHLPAKDKQVKDLIDLYASEREHDRTETTSLRITFAEEQEQTRLANAEEQRAQRESHARQMAEMQSVLLQTVKEMRTAVHDVRDTASTAINRAAIAEEQARQHGSGS